MLNRLAWFIQNLKTTDLMDMAVIAIFVYLILIWFKRARARFMLIGMLIVVGVYYLARAYQLYLTTMIFQAFFAIFFFILVVIFQDDFRHFFENLAIWGLVHRRHRKNLFGQNAEILSNVAANLSSKRIGALVVIRGRDVLERYLETGIALDGIISQFILEAVFDPDVPTHDGAVVIDGRRITRFACHLPLSTNMSQSGHLGTRHAAALGLAERTDALCIVVSQETGMVSIAESNKLRHLTSVGELAGEVEKFYDQRFPQAKRFFLLDLFIGHFIEKLLAVVIAAGIWFTFSYRTEIILRDVVIPVEYRNLPADSIISEPKPKEINVTLRGFERSFNFFDPKGFKISLDLSDVKEGENKFFFTKELLETPPGLSIINIEPDKAILTVSKMMTVNVPVVVITKGMPPPGVSIIQISVEPKEVPVIAPGNLPKDKLIVSTEEVDLKSVSKTTTLTSKLIVSPEIRLTQEKPPEAKITLEVEKRQGSRKSGQ
ncbi:MAG: diadenylate cyclase [Candidatus Omnitrophica bacterium]|nr:diadenylate cyclase [Candidatus Omnitrophota bacterium]